MTAKQAIVLAAVFSGGFLLAWMGLRSNLSPNQADLRGHQTHAGHEEGGETKHLRRGAFELHIGLAESTQGPPRLQAEAFWQEKPLDPEAVKLTASLERPHEKPEALAFDAKGDRLESLQPVPEPHVFKIQVTASYRDKTYVWAYWQVDNGIELEAAALAENGIVLQTAGPASIETLLTLPGQIRLDPSRVAHVVPRVAGVVTEVRKYLGDTVKPNAILAVLESRELADLKSDYLTARRRLELARVTFEREKQLWQEKISPELDYLQAKTRWAEAKATAEASAQKLIALDLSPAELEAITAGRDTAFNRYELRAPFAGEVVEKHLALGEGVKADAQVYTIADLATVWGEITVYSKDLNAVRKGQTVTVRAEELDQTTKGTVFYVGPLVGERTRSAKAYVAIPNPEERWRSGLFVTVEVLQEKVEVPVAVAAEAIQTWRDQSVVFVRHGDLFEPRPVVTGRRGEQSHWVEIREGLKAGERYAARGSFVLKSELGKSSAAHHH
ncbi:MAG: efflux RND transporter periplasmic adaptor subunit [Methylohalobius sp. ZOD2]|nr:efflux RND transporter periplasmic adaptor subunit [Methylothermaceae bacterium]